jgi:large subunit ribosomal protein L11
VGKLTWDQVRAIAKEKIKDMNATDIEAAARSIAGTARSMGVDVG